MLKIERDIFMVWVANSNILRLLCRHVTLHTQSNWGFKKFIIHGEFFEKFRFSSYPPRDFCLKNFFCLRQVIQSFINLRFLLLERTSGLWEFSLDFTTASNNPKFLLNNFDRTNCTFEWWILDNVFKSRNLLTYAANWSASVIRPCSRTKCS